VSDSSKAIFLSYASQDAEAARRIADALRAVGVEVWFDQNELVGGDAWDRKIREQIAACALFVPVISANTQSRKEGYFRLEWKLAEDRSHLMAKGVPFIVPVSIDATNERGALVPDAFLAVQWTKLPGGETSPAFVARVQKLLGGEAAVSGPVVGARLDRAQTEGRGPATPLRQPSWTWPVIAVVAIGVAAFFLARKSEPPAAPAKSVVETKPVETKAFSATPTASAVPPSADDKAVAVLPFKNLSGDKEQEYFSDGLTEEILNSLARERDLRVPGVTSSFSFKGKNATAAEIAKALGVSRLVEGSVQRSGTKVRIRVSLTRVADNATEELGSFTEELADIFALQEKVARVVVEKLTHRQLASSVEVNTKNSAAYDLYLRGRALQTRSRSSRMQSATLYEQAVAADPTFALAWARLAEVRTRIYSSGTDRSPAVVESSREAIDRALGARPDLPEALITRANWLRVVKLDFAAAERDLNKAESLQPPTAELRYAQAQLARDQGNWTEFVRLAQEAVTLDPQNGDNLNAIGVTLHDRGHFAEADLLYRRAMNIAGVESSTSFVNRLALRSHWRGPAAALRLLERAPLGQKGVEGMRVRLLLELGRKDEARAFILQVAPSLGGRSAPETLPVGFDSYSLEAAGLREAARKHADDERLRLQKEYDRGNHSRAVCISLVMEEALLGERETALNRLEAYRRETQSPSVHRRTGDFQIGAVGCYIVLGKFDEALEILRDMDANGYKTLSPGGGALDIGQLKSLVGGDPRFKEIFERWDAWARAQPDPVDP
jgi:TolB-like protein